MTEEPRVDPLEEGYARAERLERLVDWLGWISVIAFGCYIMLHADHNSHESLAKFIFVFLAVVSASCGFLLRHVAQSEMDRQRRLLLLSDSLGVPFSALPQHGYYTAKATPSVRRLILSLCENTYFYPRLLEAELIRPGVVVVATILGLTVALHLGTAETVELAAVLVLFSDLGLGRLIRMWWMIQQSRRLHDDCFRVLAQPSDIPLEVEALRLFGEYEAIKARASVRASDRTFARLNPRLTEEWTALSASLQEQPLRDISTPVKRGTR